GGVAVPTVKRSRSGRSQSFSACPARRSTHRVVRGDWRKRVHHRPDPGGGGGSGDRTGVAPRVLIVDDESSIRTICRVNLETDGMTVAEAVDGRDALAAIGRVQPELVLLDVMMPDVDGWQVAAELAADPATRDVPV